MKMNISCLPCLVNQVVKVAEMSDAEDKEFLFRKIFEYLSKIDFNATNPVIAGETFAILKQHINNDDPYKEIRRRYNQLFLELSETFEERINSSEDPFMQAIKYSIVGNIVDFNPIHNSCLEDIMKYFEDIDQVKLEINDVEKLKDNIVHSKRLLYLGDNCGEICLDKLLIKQIKKINPQIEITFVTRGAPVVNDSIEEDAYFVGIEQFAKIISNGDNSMGTMLHRTSLEFNNLFNKADVIISKGQSNYESLSEIDHNIFFMLVTKCDVIAKDIGIPQKSFICMNKNGVTV